MTLRRLLPPAGFRQQLASSGPSYSPDIWAYRFQPTSAKSGWVTALGGDGTSDMFVEAPQLNISPGGSWPGIATESTANHAANPPSGWVLNDVDERLDLISTAGEIGFKLSRWGGTTNTDLASGLNNFLWMIRIRNWQGTSGDDTVKGSGANFPTSKVESVSGIRLKVGDNFNSAADESGTDSSQATFPFTPAPVNGDDLFFAYMREAQTQSYRFWYAKVLPGATRADLIQGDSITNNAVYLKAAVRNDTQQQVTVKFNENTGIGELIYDPFVTDYAEVNPLVGDHFEFIISTL